MKLFQYIVEKNIGFYFILWQVINLSLIILNQDLIMSFNYEVWNIIDQNSSLINKEKYEFAYTINNIPLLIQ